MTTPVGYAEMSIEYRHASDPEPWYNVVGVEVDLGLNTMQEHVDHVAGVWYSHLVGSLPGAVTLTNCIGRFGQDGNPDVIIETSVAPLNGTSNDAKLPQNCALLVRKQTSLGGRQGRGRIFVPGVLNESSVDAVGVLANADRAVIQAVWDDLLLDLAAADPVSGATTPMVILHGPTLESSVPRTPTPVESLIVDSRISTQRRRLR